MTRAEAARQVYLLWALGNPDVAPTPEKIVDTVIDALGLREELSGLYVTNDGKVGTKYRARHRYVTEWEAVEDD